MIDWIVQGSLIILMIASLIGLIDGVIEYRNSPYLAWLRQQTEERIKELNDSDDDKD